MGILFQSDRDEFHPHIYFRQIHQLALYNEWFFSMADRLDRQAIQYTSHDPLYDIDQVAFPLLPLPKKNIPAGMSETTAPKIFIATNPAALGKAAGLAAALSIKQAIAEKGGASIILATGTSQFETLNQLVAEHGIEWGKVTMFHLDEYIGLPITARASFRKYLQERFIDKVPALGSVHLINGGHDPVTECKRLAALIGLHPIDVALVGIGENGHLAFNDPPADFDTGDPYIIVELDEMCRRQQLNEGWFDTFDAVPRQAISMSIQQIMRSKQIICSVPDGRKAEAVRGSLEGRVSNLVPASILREHGNCSFYLDRHSAALLSNRVLSETK
jgi:glucosamine-6-phosphate deaminase